MNDIELIMQAIKQDQSLQQNEVESSRRTRKAIKRECDLDEARLMADYFASANNDLTVLNNSLLFDELLDDIAPMVTFEVNMVTFEKGVIRTKKYDELSATKKNQADCDMKAFNIILHGLPTDIYSLVNHHRLTNYLWEKFQLLMQGTSLTKQERECKLANILGTCGNNLDQQRVMKCFNYQGEGHMERQCLKPKRKRDATWFRDKVLLVKAQVSDKVLNEEELEFLADPGVTEGPVTQTIITHNAAYQADDLDVYDSDCNDFSTAKAVLMSNLSIPNLSPLRKQKKKEEWKPTGKVFTTIGYNWRPTERTFTLVGNACLLTKIIATNKVPLRETIHLESIEQEYVVAKVYIRRPKGSNTSVALSSSSFVDLRLMRVASINKKKYILVILDDYSQFTWVKFLASKDEAYDFIIKFLKMIQVRLNATVRNIHTYNGTEFVIQTLRDYYKHVGIYHLTSVARTPQQNGVVERQNCMIVEATHTMLIFAQALIFLWAKAFATAFPVAAAPRVVNLADSSVSTSIDQYAPSTQDQEHSPIIFQGFEESPKTPHSHDDPLNESLHEDSTSQGSSSNVRPIHTPFESLGVVDPTLFTWKARNDLLLVQIYVDDIRFASTNTALCNEFANLMTTKFKMSMMGQMSFFLGLQISQSPRGIFLNQLKYAYEIIKKYSMLTSDSVDTLRVEKSNLDEDLQGKPVDATLYRGKIGSLMYLTFSRPDLIYAVCLCARDTSMSLTAYADADHAGYQDTRHSTSGSAQFLCDKLVSWSSKK
nr:hypothetical protein [Tanacetum cinerariifolium]